MVKQKKKQTKGQKITTDTVIHVARLARINISEADARKYQKELNEILAAFRALKGVKKSTKPSFHPLAVKDVTRKDEVEESFYQEQALANARHKEKGYFKGPRSV